MRALSLLGVFVVAKITILAGHRIPLSLWTPIAYFWQDLLAALLFAVLDFAIRRQWLQWTLYGATVAYVAVNVPIVRVLSSPLTWLMMRAARGTLSGSIRHHITWENLALMLLIVFAGLILPLLVCRVGQQLHPKARLVPLLSMVTLAFAMLLLGPLATSRVETIGLHRNALVTLAMTALPRVSSEHANGDWRASPFDNSTGEDLSRFHGRAAGRNV